MLLWRNNVFPTSETIDPSITEKRQAQAQAQAQAQKMEVVVTLMS